jgi:hypothetical protein
MTGNNTGITKSFRLISLNAYNAWIKVSINSQIIAERTVNYPNIGQGASISGPDIMSLNSTKMYILENFTDPVRIMEDGYAKKLCYEISWSCSANLELYQVEIPEPDDKLIIKPIKPIKPINPPDPLEPLEPIESTDLAVPLEEITSPINVKAIGGGHGWIKAGITVNGITKTITKIIKVWEDQSISVTLNHYSVAGGQDIYVDAITSPYANTYEWLLDDHLSILKERDGLISRCPSVVLQYNPNITPRLVTLTVTASDNITGISGTASFRVHGSYTLSRLCIDYVFLVYPNPVFDILNIEIIPQLQDIQSKQASIAVSNKTYDISLYTVLGNQVLHTSGGVGKTMINVSDIPSGVYILRIYDGVTKPVTRSIIVEH